MLARKNLFAIKNPFDSSFKEDKIKNKNKEQSPKGIICK